MVPSSFEACLGAASLALWSGVDFSVYHNSCLLWIRGRSFLQRANIFLGLSALHFKSDFQFGFHPDPIQSQKQFSRRLRCLAGAGDACLGDGCYLACLAGTWKRRRTACPLDRARERAISSVGMFRDGASTHRYMAELEVSDRFSKPFLNASLSQEGFFA